ncbi:ABC-type multidrug transport system, ATPase component [Amycolatopsis marina]|uniref:ABC-type multidrug transport system, ATPase component n=1 Tax=Amycolatopsis marina TaxID=490629 RepID=A0A1I0W0E4_9PSEU|nr:ABC transporter ATP-binding protein [Amycolatopsis marina]SFA81984.1 ABC-type multidrug transport system, ATPase component [Amycolatopsis marina]
MLRLRGVSKRYGRGAVVLDRVDLTLAEGQVVGLLGGNGSGKSTLLRILAGLSAPTSGAITGPVLRGAVGYLPDRFPAATRMTVRSYLRHLARISGVPASVADRRGEKLLDRLALVGGPSTPLRELSKGNAQKVGLVQAVLHEPRLVLLDEPFSGLDVSAHHVVGELIAATAGRGGCVVFTEHRSAVAAEYADVLYQVSGRTLAPFTAPEPACPRVRIVLATALADEWTAEPGVLDVTEREGLVELVVDSARCDETLLLALRRGNSVRVVEPLEVGESCSR